MILSSYEPSGVSGSISVLRSRVSNAGVRTLIAEMTVGINVHSSVIEGTVREKIWYDLMPSSNCPLSTKIVVYHKAIA